MPLPLLLLTVLVAKADPVFPPEEVLLNTFTVILGLVQSSLIVLVEL